MLEMRRNPRRKWRVIYVDVEGADSPADFLAMVFAELAACPDYRSWFESIPMGKSLSDVWQRVRNAQITTPFLQVELRSAMGNEWPDAMDRLQARLAKLPAIDARLLIVVDELPVLVSRMLRQERGRDNVELLLAKLRGWRQSPVLRGKVHTLVGGSIGLDGVLRRQGLSALINDLVPFRLESWDRRTAVEFLHQLGRNHNFRLSDDRIGVMLDLLQDPVPYHVQLFFHELFAKINGSAPEVTVDDVQSCFDDRLTGPGGTPHLDHYAARLEVAMDAASYDVAEEILRLASSPSGAATIDVEAMTNARGVALRSILNDLEFDGYVVRRGDRIAFRSNLLRTWWRKNRGGGAS